MEENDKSPVIDRLVQFINYTGLSSSQFADKTGIPRPSLSQMLHGRNKSVNNQVLTKLHTSFPALNILWLLFGKGDMLQNLNIKISEPQNEISNDLMSLKLPENQAEEQYDMAFSSSLFSPTKNEFVDDKENVRHSTPPLSNESSVHDRKISSIIVLYTDGSFETFNPAST